MKKLDYVQNSIKKIKSKKDLADGIMETEYNLKEIDRNDFNVKRMDRQPRSRGKGVFRENLKLRKELGLETMKVREVEKKFGDLMKMYGSITEVNEDERFKNVREENQELRRRLEEYVRIH
jgi:hypothetical protein